MGLFGPEESKVRVVLLNAEVGVGKKPHSQEKHYGKAHAMPLSCRRRGQPWTFYTQCSTYLKGEEGGWASESTRGLCVCVYVELKAEALDNNTGKPLHTIAKGGGQGVYVCARTLSLSL